MVHQLVCPRCTIFLTFFHTISVIFLPVSVVFGVFISPVGYFGLFRSIFGDFSGISGKIWGVMLTLLLPLLPSSLLAPPR